MTLELCFIVGVVATLKGVCVKGPRGFEARRLPRPLIVKLLPGKVVEMSIFLKYMRIIVTIVSTTL
jgi:hypothetical protein